MSLEEQAGQDLDRQDAGLLPGTTEWDDAKIARLYKEFADEDRTLAEAGMSDYASGLAREDAGNWQTMT